MTAQIPFNFFAIPTYFDKAGWMRDCKSTAFLHWAFKRCSNIYRKIWFSKRVVDLEPYEFIFGRSICAEDTGLTEREVRTLIGSLLRSGHLVKVERKCTNRFSVYRWLTEAFCDEANQQTTSRRPADDHNLDYRSRSREEEKKKEKEKASAEAPAQAAADASAPPPPEKEQKKKPRAKTKTSADRPGTVQYDQSDGEGEIGKVFLTPREYTKLVEKLGEEKAKRCILLLSLYKRGKGEEYIDDNAAILKWVIKAVEKEMIEEQQLESKKQSQKSGNGRQFPPSGYSAMTPEQQNVVYAEAASHMISKHSSSECINVNGQTIFIHSGDKKLEVNASQFAPSEFQKKLNSWMKDKTGGRVQDAESMYFDLINARRLWAPR